MWTKILLWLLATVSVTFACRDSSSRAEIICYYDGLLEPSLIDPCKCTLLVFAKVKVDAYFKLVSDLDFSALNDLKKKNPNLKLIASIGGRHVKPETFVSALSSVEATANFTEGVASFVTGHSLDGVEINWRWPGMPKGVKSKDDLTTLMKVIRLAIDDQSHNVSRREISAPDLENGSTFSLLDIFEEDIDDPHLDEERVHSVAFPSTETPYFSTINSIDNQPTTETPTTEDTFTKNLLENFELTGNEEVDPSGAIGPDYLLLDDYSLNSEIPEAEISEISENQDKENSGKTPAKTITLTESQKKKDKIRGSIKFQDHFQTSDLRALEVVAKQQGARGGWKIARKRVIGPAERIIRPLEKRIGSSKILILTISPRPEYIVKGYDLKALTSIVDMFSVPSNNLTANSVGSSQNGPFTYHHSRLMGVSDIQNADSLIDLIVSMGVPLDRLILGATTTGSSFELINSTENTPRSPAKDYPSWIPYRKVCTLLRKGNWTLERDDDLTGPYAYENNQWMAFDDPISLRVKSKYALLRGLAGIGLVADDDDWAGICSQGAYPLITAVHDTFTQLARTPRKAVLRGLVRDLETAESTIRATFEGSATDLRISPFRIVRVVDRNGDIKAVRSSGDTRYECSRQGYYRDPADCSQFYRCVKFNQYIDDYTIFEYSCPVGLVFDDRWEICAWPSTASPCDGSSEIFPVPRMKNICSQEGYFTDPENCRWFFACRDYYGNNTFTHYEFRCPFGLAYDEENQICNWPWLVPSCGEYDPTQSSRGQGKAIQSGHSAQPLQENVPFKECVNCNEAEIIIKGDGIYHPEKGIIVSSTYFDRVSDQESFKLAAPIQGLKKSQTSISNQKNKQNNRSQTGRESAIKNIVGKTFTNQDTDPQFYDRLNEHNEEAKNRENLQYSSDSEQNNGNVNNAIFISKNQETLNPFSQTYSINEKGILESSISADAQQARGFQPNKSLNNPQIPKLDQTSAHGSLITSNRGATKYSDFKDNSDHKSVKVSPIKNTKVNLDSSHQTEYNNFDHTGFINTDISSGNSQNSDLKFNSNQKYSSANKDKSNIDNFDTGSIENPEGQAGRFDVPNSATESHRFKVSDNAAKQTIGVNAQNVAIAKTSSIRRKLGGTLSHLSNGDALLSNYQTSDKSTSKTLDGEAINVSQNFKTSQQQINKKSRGQANIENFKSEKVPAPTHFGISQSQETLPFKGSSTPKHSTGHILNPTIQIEEHSLSGDEYSKGEVENSQEWYKSSGFSNSQDQFSSLSLSTFSKNDQININKDLPHGRYKSTDDISSTQHSSSIGGISKVSKSRNTANDQSNFELGSKYGGNNRENTQLKDNSPYNRNGESVPVGGSLNHGRNNGITSKQSTGRYSSNQPITSEAHFEQTSNIGNVRNSGDVRDTKLDKSFAHTRTSQVTSIKDSSQSTNSQFIKTSEILEKKQPLHFGRVGASNTGLDNLNGDRRGSIKLSQQENSEAQYKGSSEPDLEVYKDSKISLIGTPTHFSGNPKITFDNSGRTFTQDAITSSELAVAGIRNQENSRSGNSEISVGENKNYGSGQLKETIGSLAINQGTGKEKVSHFGGSRVNSGTFVGGNEKSVAPNGSSAYNQGTGNEKVSHFGSSRANSGTFVGGNKKSVSPNGSLAYNQGTGNEKVSHFGGSRVNSGTFAVTTENYGTGQLNVPIGGSASNQGTGNEKVFYFGGTKVNVEAFVGGNEKSVSPNGNLAYNQGTGNGKVSHFGGSRVYSGTFVGGNEKSVSPNGNSAYNQGTGNEKVSNFGGSKVNSGTFVGGKEKSVSPNGSSAYNQGTGNEKVSHFGGSRVNSEAFVRGNEKSASPNGYSANNQGIGNEKATHFEGSRVNTGTFVGGNEKSVSPNGSSAYNQGTSNEKVSHFGGSRVNSETFVSGNEKSVSQNGNLAYNQGSGNENVSHFGGSRVNSGTFVGGNEKSVSSNGNSAYNQGTGNDEASNIGGSKANSGTFVGGNEKSVSPNRNTANNQGTGNEKVSHFGGTRFNSGTFVGGNEKSVSPNGNSAYNQGTGNDEASNIGGSKANSGTFVGGNEKSVSSNGNSAYNQGTGNDEASNIGGSKANSGTFVGGNEKSVSPNGNTANNQGTGNEKVSHFGGTRFNSGTFVGGNEKSVSPNGNSAYNQGTGNEKVSNFGGSKVSSGTFVGGKEKSVSPNGSSAYNQGTGNEKVSHFGGSRVNSGTFVGGNEKSVSPNGSLAYNQGTGNEKVSNFGGSKVNSGTLVGGKEKSVSPNGSSAYNQGTGNEKVSHFGSSRLNSGTFVGGNEKSVSPNGSSAYNQGTGNEKVSNFGGGKVNSGTFVGGKEKSVSPNGSSAYNQGTGNENVSHFGGSRVNSGTFVGGKVKSVSPNGSSAYNQGTGNEKVSHFGGSRVNSGTFVGGNEKSVSPNGNSAYNQGTGKEKVSHFGGSMANSGTFVGGTEKSVLHPLGSSSRTGSTGNINESRENLGYITSPESGNTLRQLSQPSTSSDTKLGSSRQTNSGLLTNSEHSFGTNQNSKSPRNGASNNNKIPIIKPVIPASSQGSVANTLSTSKTIANSQNLRTDDGSYKETNSLQGKSINPRLSPTGPFLSNNNPTNGFSIRKPVVGGPSLLAKFGKRPKIQRFGPGGFRDFDDDLGPEVCERAGLFRHPDSCDKFYECYWDRWIEKFTLHVFDCPVTIVYDTTITACNWPFNGPPCIED